jgi:stage III sporulation protein AG
MIKLVSRFKELPDRKRNIILCIIGAIALLIIVVSELFTGEDIPSPQENRSEYAEDYIERTEKELCSILEDIDGAGRVEVMITLESCYENVYAKGHSTQKDVDDSGEQSQLTEEYVIVKNGSGTEECLVVKVYEPVVKGVAVVAEGADNAQVKKAITETVCALFDISSNKVSVIKKYEE